MLGRVVCTDSVGEERQTVKTLSLDALQPQEAPYHLACEQALIFVVIMDVARAAKPRVKSLAGLLRSPTRNSRLRRSRHIHYNNENESLYAGYVPPF